MALIELSSRDQVANDQSQKVIVYVQLTIQKYIWKCTPYTTVPWSDSSYSHDDMCYAVMQLAAKALKTGQDDEPSSDTAHEEDVADNSGSAVASIEQAPAVRPAPNTAAADS